MTRLVRRALNRLRSMSSAAAFDDGRRNGEQNRLVAEAKTALNALARLPSLKHKVEFLLGFQPFRPLQKLCEFYELLQRVEEVRPERICEIGGKAGGTIGLFMSAAAAGARGLSIDLSYSPQSIAGIEMLASPGTRIRCLRADSHDSATLAYVADWLGGGQIDLLFIDGDHSLEGVNADYEMYAPFVRKGGIIAFHDIVPDYRSRFGVLTEREVGGVPAFWEQTKRTQPDWEELIADPEQDGYGIGVLRKA